MPTTKTPVKKRRPGAPTKDGAPRTRFAGIRMKDRDHAYICKLGGGVFADGVDALIKFHKENS